ncbi:Peroxidase 52 [Vitis vinifera]|uniref:Peroxidase n=1 Tax=Vitis vinifera TaxID=29760 RepID=A0A438E419_VITVI|nr:Peroxidase 52 [Vitis vinifera]
MASPSSYMAIVTMALLILLGQLHCSTFNRLLLPILSKALPHCEVAVKSAVAKEARMGASLLRLFFHDCFVNGCDGSVLLDDTSSFIGEKNAAPNANSVRGFDVVDDIKSKVETACPGVVSCADVLAIAARDSVVIVTWRPSWNVKLGRRDARTASQAAANNSIPPPTSNLNQLISRFQALGLSTRDLVALAEQLPKSQWLRGQQLGPLDLQTPTAFENNYYKNLIKKKGLLHSDQQLFNGVSTDSIVRSTATAGANFNADFVAGMIRWEISAHSLDQMERLGRTAEG